MVMRGLMSNPKGKIIELPVKSSFSEGLNLSEFFISIHGARKGMIDVSLKTADAGYLTRRLVDTTQRVIVTSEDCRTTKKFLISDIVDTKLNEIIVPFSNRLFGRYLAEDVYHPETNELVASNETLMIGDIYHKVLETGIKQIYVRSILTCNLDLSDVCSRCYGMNLANGQVVEIGTAVGIIAAQSIGEPGTQLTM
jgi:DNA-directed RNA polymerase subunit beta'